MAISFRKLYPAAGLLISVMLLSACAGDQVGNATQGQDQELPPKEIILTLPDLEAVDLNGRPLKVVATTSIIGDVVNQIGGDKIDLLTLMDPGQDPHSYEPSAGDLTAVSGADVIFVNGWDLEEGLVDDLATISTNTPIVPVSANITPLDFEGNGTAAHLDESGEEEHHAVDPHTWFAVPNVQQWTENIAATLSELDPPNEAIYKQKGQAYAAKLQELNLDLHRQIESIPVEKRILVTNHDSLGYFAEEYDIKVVGTVISSSSTLSEPSASDLADLTRLMEELGICTIFSETTMSDRLPQTVAQELSRCEQVKILPLYSGSIGPPGSGADSYLGMMEANVANIVIGLQ